MYVGSERSRGEGGVGASGKCCRPYVPRDDYSVKSLLKDSRERFLKTNKFLTPVLQGRETGQRAKTREVCLTSCKINVQRLRAVPPR